MNQIPTQIKGLLAGKEIFEFFLVDGRSVKLPAKWLQDYLGTLENLQTTYSISEVGDYIYWGHLDRAVYVDDILDHNLLNGLMNSKFRLRELTFLDDRSIQRFLREVNNNDLVNILLSLPKEYLMHIRKNMSARSFEMLIQDLQATKDLRTSDRLTSIRNVESTINQLIDSGEIVLGRNRNTEAVEGHASNQSQQEPVQDLKPRRKFKIAKEDPIESFLSSIGFYLVGFIAVSVFIYVFLLKFGIVSAK